MIYCSNENTDYPLSSNRVKLEKLKMKNIRFPQRCFLLVCKFDLNLPTKETSRKISSLKYSLIFVVPSGTSTCFVLR